jgi:hypothetical protein
LTKGLEEEAFGIVLQDLKLDSTLSVANANLKPDLEEVTVPGSEVTDFIEGFRPVVEANDLEGRPDRASEGGCRSLRLGGWLHLRVTPKVVAVVRCAPVLRSL